MSSETNSTATVEQPPPAAAEPTPAPAPPYKDPAANHVLYTRDCPAMGTTVHDAPPTEVPPGHERVRELFSGKMVDVPIRQREPFVERPVPVTPARLAA